MQSLGVKRQGGAEPTETWQIILSALDLPHLDDSFEALLAERTPYTPDERPRSVYDWYPQASSDEEMHPVDDA